MMGSTGDRLAVAAEHLRRRRLSAAAATYREILAEDPNHVEALNGLAVEALMRGSGEAALTFLAHAAAIDPSDATTFANLGQAHILSGRPDEAEACLDMALRLAPDHIDAAIGRAIVLRRRDPDGAFEELRALAARHPRHALLQHNLGAAYAERREVVQAAKALRNAVTLDPSLADAWRGLGLLEATSGPTESALACLRRAHELAPASLPNVMAFGDLLLKTGGAEEAERLARRAAALSPLSAEPLVLQGRALLMLKRVDEGFKTLAKASHIAPKAPLPFLALAEAFMEHGDLDQAAVCAEEAATLAADAPPIRLAGIALLLRCGRWQAGWRAMSGLLPEELSLTGQTVTLAAPSSFADTLFFARLSPLAAAAGGKVRLVGRTPLAGLLAGTPGLILEEASAVAPVGDLTLLGALLAPEPARTPWLDLNVDGRRAADWRRELQGGARPAVAIAWDEGGPLSLSDLLASLPPGSLCVSLVTGRARAALSAFPQVFDAGSRLRDYGDLAAILTAVDAVLLPDGPAAHLAGALGTRGVVATERGHFAWGATEAPAPWYPSLRVTAKHDSDALARLLREAMT
jgi:tetratricopeptide (TPR) repeat protein